MVWPFCLLGATLAIAVAVVYAPVVLYQEYKALMQSPQYQHHDDLHRPVMRQPWSLGALLGSPEPWSGD